MGDEKRSSIATKADALKKAGLHPIVTGIILLASTPGFYEFFFNRTDDVANRKADVAYEVLAKEIEHLRRDDKGLEKEIQNINNFLLMTHAARMGVPTVDPITDTTEAMAERDAILKDRGASLESEGGEGAEGAGEYMEEEDRAPPAPSDGKRVHALKQMADEDDDPVKERGRLPDLEDMIK